MAIAQAAEIVDPVRLGRELRVRGKDWMDLSRGPHRLNPTTIGRLRHRRPVSTRTLRTLALWLRSTPVLSELEAILAPAEGAA